jgi:hypothetical protein
MKNRIVRMENLIAGRAAAQIFLRKTDIFLAFAITLLVVAAAAQAFRSWNDHPRTPWLALIAFPIGFAAEIGLSRRLSRMSEDGLLSVDALDPKSSAAYRLDRHVILGVLTALFGALLCCYSVEAAVISLVGSGTFYVFGTMFARLSGATRGKSLRMDPFDRGDRGTSPAPSRGLFNIVMSRQLPLGATAKNTWTIVAFMGLLLGASIAMTDRYSDHDRVRFAIIPIIFLGTLALTRRDIAFARFMNLSGIRPFRMIASLLLPSWVFAGTCILSTTLVARPFDAASITGALLTVAFSSLVIAILYLRYLWMGPRIAEILTAIDIGILLYATSLNPWLGGAYGVVRMGFLCRTATSHRWLITR